MDQGRSISVAHMRWAHMEWDVGTMALTRRAILQVIIDTEGKEE